MIVHSFQTHVRDQWCLEFHLSIYLKFCEMCVVAVDNNEELADWLNEMDRVIAVNHVDPRDFGIDRCNEHGTFYPEGPLRQVSLDRAMKLNPSLIVFGDTDELPTPDVLTWIETVKNLPQLGYRWYVDWVTLWQDYQHRIGGQSVWSFDHPRSNKKCLAMQPGGDMVYPDHNHTGMEPGRFGGGPAPTGEGRFLIESPRLVHLKYGSEIYKTRPESKLVRHKPETMLAGGCVVDVPSGWIWEGTPT